MKAGMFKFACSGAGISLNCSVAGATLSPLGLIAVVAIMLPVASSVINNKEIVGRVKALITNN